MILVAPWLDVEKNIPKRGGSDFFDFDIDPAVTNKANKFTVFESTDDMPEVQSSRRLIEQSIPNIKIREFANYGHFMEPSMKTNAFPELAQEILGENY